METGGGMSEQVADYTDEDLIRWYCDEGLTMEECGERVGITRERVRQRLERNGVTGKTHGPRLTDKQKDRLAWLYTNTNEPVTRCAEVVGISAGHARQILRRRGIDIELRPYGLQVSEDEQRRIVEAYRNGYGFNRITEEFGHNNITAKKVLERWGVRIRGPGEKVSDPRHVDDAERNEMVALRGQGASVSEIARQLDRAWLTVRRHLDIAGVE